VFSVVNIFMNNQQLSQTFSDIAHLLEIKGEVIYKILAYSKARIL